MPAVFLGTIAHFCFAAITTRLVDAISIPILLKLVQSHKINPSVLITHSKCPFKTPGDYSIKISCLIAH
jgi:hypothetical protein